MSGKKRWVNALSGAKKGRGNRRKTMCEAGLLNTGLSVRCLGLLGDRCQGPWTEEFSPYGGTVEKSFPSWPCRLWTWCTVLCLDSVDRELTLPCRHAAFRLLLKVMLK